MDSESLLFSHQRSVALKLSERFSRTTVLTADSKWQETGGGIPIISSRWVPGKRFLSAVRFLWLVTPVILKDRGHIVVFSHMTEVQSLLIAPLCKLLGIDHYLWFAHARKSPYLLLAYPFLSGVITSTSGSCPVSGKKVHVIGQGIHLMKTGVSHQMPNIPPIKWYHIGRIDSSKRIELIIEAVKEARKCNDKLSVDFFGLPSESVSTLYYKSLIELSKGENYRSWLHFRGPISRNDIYKVSQMYDGFIHAFDGSLDKALLESVICRRVVVTLNNEFHREFADNIHGWGYANQNLGDQLIQTLSQKPDSILNLLESRYEIATNKHSLEGWIKRLYGVLVDE